MGSHPTTSAKGILAQQLGRFTEQDAQELLDFLRAKEALSKARRLSRDEWLGRAAACPGLGLPDPDAPPFEKAAPIPTRGVPASELLISDRR